MLRPVLKCAALVVLPVSCLLADFSYEQTSKLTGGMMAGMMKFAGAFSKQAREPMRSTVAVKGDRMVHWSQYHASIIDLSKETITDIDLQKKQYSVMTFAEMARAMEEASQKLKDARKEDGQAPEMNYKVSVNDTGQTKQIGGYNTKEVILKIEIETKDPKSGQTSTMVVTADSWLAPKVAGYDEVTDFYKRMGQKVSWAPGATGMFTGGRSDLSKAMADMYKEGSKLNGIPVYQVTKIGMQGLPNQGGNGGSPEQAQAQQQQQQQQQQPPPQVEKPSVGGALGSALGGRLGGLGGFGRRRKPKEEAPPAETAQQSAPAQAPAAQQPAPQGSPDASGALMEMTSEMTGFSATADASKFEVPAGFKQVQPDKRAR